MHSIANRALLSDCWRFLSIDSALSNFEIADYDHQKVIEVVSDTTSELTDRFHLLHLRHALSRLVQQMLRLALLCHVAGYFCKANKGPTAVVDWVNHNTCPKLIPVLADSPSFSLELALSGCLMKGLCWKTRFYICPCVEA